MTCSRDFILQKGFLSKKKKNSANGDLSSAVNFANKIPKYSENCNQLYRIHTWAEILRYIFSNMIKKKNVLRFSLDAMCLLFLLFVIGNKSFFFSCSPFDSNFHYLYLQDCKVTMNLNFSRFIIYCEKKLCLQNFHQSFFLLLFLLLHCILWEESNQR